MKLTREQLVQYELDAYNADITTFIDDNVGYDHYSDVYYDYLTDPEIEETEDPF